MRTNHLLLSDDTFKTAFEKCTLPSTQFNHEAHLRLAWIHINQVEVEAAVELICRQIERYAASLGEHQIYHTTLTVAAVRMVNHFMLQSKATNFVDFVAEFPELKTQFKELISQHYSFDIFASAKAKSMYVAPDLLPF